jgi:hypothetical protein
VTAVLSPLSSVQELVQLTPPRVGHPDVNFGDVAAPPGIAETTPVVVVPSPQPSAQELALLTPPRDANAARGRWRLARFRDEVRVER